MKPTTVSVLPHPGLNISLLLNSSNKINPQKAFPNLIPSKMIDVSAKAPNGAQPPQAGLPGALPLGMPGFPGVLPNQPIALGNGRPRLVLPPPNLMGLPGIPNLPTTGDSGAQPVLPPNLQELATGNKKPEQPQAKGNETEKMAVETEIKE